jgi:NAD(P)-dependent dehydrogenase (short-subunit alcohol dehydrogenase family)
VQSKVVLVTGGAQGLGRAVVLAFARRGAGVAIADSDRERACETARDAAAAGGRACVIEGDVSARGAAELMVSRTVAELGALNVLVNNAGTWSVQPFLDITDDDWDRVFRVNVHGLLRCLQAAARHMRANAGGAIINITSPASRMALPNYAAYAASKAAVDSITRSAAVALGRDRITVNCVAPGRMDTEMQRATEKRFAALAGMDLAAFVERRTTDLPLGRRTSPEEVAETVVWLASPEAAYMTGARLNVSGGLELD